MMEGPWKRQSPLDNNDDDDNGGGYWGDPTWGNPNNESWWWTPTGMAVRYAIVALLFLALLTFFIGGYYHAKHRLRNGRPLKSYHRWMVRRQPQPYYHHSQQSYGMEAYPPPAYNHAEAPPPVYQPPAGASKAMADQNFVETTRAAGEGSGSGGVSAPAATARQ